jgi:hypothetical protein
MSSVEKESPSEPVTRDDTREDSDIDTFVFAKTKIRNEFVSRIVDIAGDTDMDEGEYKIFFASL